MKTAGTMTGMVQVGGDDAMAASLSQVFLQ